MKFKDMTDAELALHIELRETRLALVNSALDLNVERHARATAEEQLAKHAGRETQAELKLLDEEAARRKAAKAESQKKLAAAERRTAKALAKARANQPVAVSQ
jgi:hypothetical protein